MSVVQSRYTNAKCGWPVIWCASGKTILESPMPVVQSCCANRKCPRTVILSYYSLPFLHYSLLFVTIPPLFVSIPPLFTTIRYYSSTIPPLFFRISYYSLLLVEYYRVLPHANQVEKASQLYFMPVAQSCYADTNHMVYHL
jgi:hypothetical protein